MGSYRQHMTFASFLGAFYAWAIYALTGIHWIYGTVAALLATVGGLLPDLDSPSGVGLRGLTGLLAVLAAVAVWQRSATMEPGPAFELCLWLTIVTFIAVRYTLQHIVGRLTVHRGMHHSLPMCLIWGCLTYLIYPSDYHPIRVAMSLGVMLGFMSHLVLDEAFSVDLAGARLNRAFGTALKLWSGSTMATLWVYAVLAYLSWCVVEFWPQDPDAIFARVPNPAPNWSEWVPRLANIENQPDWKK